jgi:hypothetical protein
MTRTGPRSLESPKEVNLTRFPHRTGMGSAIVFMQALAVKANGEP